MPLYSLPLYFTAFKPVSFFAYSQAFFVIRELCHPSFMYSFSLFFPCPYPANPFSLVSFLSFNLPRPFLSFVLLSLLPFIFTLSVSLIAHSCCPSPFLLVSHFWSLFGLFMTASVSLLYLTYFLATLSGWIASFLMFAPSLSVYSVVFKNVNFFVSQQSICSDSPPFYSLDSCLYTRQVVNLISCCFSLSQAPFCQSFLS